MKRGYFIKKAKFNNNALRKQCLYILLPCYLAFVFALAGGYIGVLLSKPGESVLTAVGLAFLGAFLFVSLAVAFVIIPCLRARKAVSDLKNYDFSPHAATDEEKFESSVRLYNYYLNASPFETGDLKLEIEGEGRLNEYLEQYRADGVLGMAYTTPRDAFLPLFYFDMCNKADDGARFLIEKREENDRVILSVTQFFAVTFTPDGISVSGRLYPYDEAVGSVDARFNQSEASASPRLFLLFPDGFAISFALSSRIMSIADRYSIKIDDREIADFILSDPVRAFKTIGFKRTPERIKKAAMACLANQR